jgi:hypothetical protein
MYYSWNDLHEMLMGVPSRRRSINDISGSTTETFRLGKRGGPEI